MTTNHPQVFVISDSIGETAEMMVWAATSQFDSGKIEIRRIPNVNDTDTIDDILQQAAEIHCMVAYTMVISDMKNYLDAKARELGVITVDLLSPVMDAVQQATGLIPRREPGILRKVDEVYFRRVEAIEFAVRYDDGKDPRGIQLADIVLVGVSRTSKTPLSMYLAHKRIKVANVPLVPEVAPPEELFQAERGKIIGLSIRPEQLVHIRKERLKSMGLMSDASYANEERILQEMEYAHDIMRRLGCPVIDVTNKAVEETSSKILEIYYRRLSHV
ncbi:MAG: pyruvate, water dikinase regulatory protein [Solirubrobacterales bacterium]